MNLRKIYEKISKSYENFTTDHFSFLIFKAGNTKLGGRLSAVDLLIKVTRFLQKVKKVANIKMS
jgi:hypothetical protein